MALLKLTIRYHLLKVEVDIVKDIVYTKMKFCLQLLNLMSSSPSFICEKSYFVKCLKVVWLLMHCKISFHKTKNIRKCRKESNWLMFIFG